MDEEFFLARGLANAHVLCPLFHAVDTRDALLAELSKERAEAVRRAERARGLGYADVATAHAEYARLLDASVDEVVAADRVVRDAEAAAGAAAAEGRRARSRSGPAWVTRWRPATS